MSEWKTMATAPRDGTRILVCWAGESWGHQIVEWVDWRPGWYNGDGTYGADTFTHWMPLPDPPASTDRGE